MVDLNNATIEDLLFGDELDECNKPITEAVDVSALSDELEALKADYEDFGAEGFYNISFENFKNNYPEFSDKVLNSFLTSYVEITPEEMQDPEVINAWETGELVVPDDWPALFDYAEKLIANKPHQWKDIYKKNYDDVIDEEVEDTTANSPVETANTEKVADESAPEHLQEDLNVVSLTPEDQATNIRGLIKTCWNNVDEFSAYSQMLNDFGNQQALEVVNNLINDLYIAIGSFEDLLNSLDTKSTAIDAGDQVQALVQVSPEVAQQLMQPAVPVLEKFILDENDTLNEEVEKPDAQEFVEKDKELQKALKVVEKQVDEKNEDDLTRPDWEVKDEETETVDESYNPKFFESLLKLED